MALTPMDIYNKEFKTAWKGYNRDQVDAFLDQIIIDFKSLLEGDGEVKTSPDEVRLKRFARTTRGYEADDVDAFLLQVAQDFSELLGQRRRAEEAARARRAGAQRAVVPPVAPEPAPVVVEPTPAAAPVAPEPAPVAPAPAPVAPEPAPVAPEPAPVAPEPAPVAPEPAPVAPEPAPAAPPLDITPEPQAQPLAQPAPVSVTQAYSTPTRAGAGALPVEIPAGAGTIRLSLSGGRIFLTAEAQDLTVRKELDAAAARRLGEALLRMTESLER